jgi:mono/diheme cytochrome c family protein
MIKKSFLPFAFVLVLLSGCGGGQTGSHLPQKTTPEAVVDDGKSVYLKYCLACHQTDGSGVPGMYPPLKNSDWLSKEKEVLIRQVLEGKKGIIVVNGTQFNQVMPKQDFLTNAQIASVLTYVRKEMGNQTDSITVLEVSKIRESLH